jgi:hypothetical protein
MEVFQGRLNPDSEVGARFFAEFTLNAVKGLNDNYLLVILNGASLREESQTKIKESAYKERSTSEFGLNNCFHTPRPARSAILS